MTKRQCVAKGLYPIMTMTVSLILCTGVAQGDVKRMRAEAEIRGCTDPNIIGTARLVEEMTEEGIKQVRVTMVVKGLSDGKHAVHIHETAVCEPCGDAKGHHDPGPNSNSDPDAPDFNHPYHMGDLVNLEVRHGVGVMHTTTNRITLSKGRLSIFDEDGSAVIVHTNEDTYCDQEDELSPGCAGGARDACGIIRPIEGDHGRFHDDGERGS